MGRGFQGKVALDEEGHVEQLENDDETTVDNAGQQQLAPIAANYWETFLNKRTGLLCMTGFFFHFANANVLLVLGELMGQSDDEDGTPRRSAIPLIAGAIVTAQLMMAAATSVGNRLTMRGVGRKPLFMVGLLTLPLRCALIILWENAGDSWLLSTQLLDGIGGGFLGLIHPVRCSVFGYCTEKHDVLTRVYLSNLFFVALHVSISSRTLLLDLVGSTSSWGSPRLSLGKLDAAIILSWIVAHHANRQSSQHPSLFHSAVSARLFQILLARWSLKDSATLRA